MLETATTTELAWHYETAHVARAETFRTPFRWVARVLRQEKAPRRSAGLEKTVGPEDCPA